MIDSIYSINCHQSQPLDQREQGCEKQTQAYERQMQATEKPGRDRRRGAPSAREPPTAGIGSSGIAGQAERSDRTVLVLSLV